MKSTIRLACAGNDFLLFPEGELLHFLDSFSMIIFVVTKRYHYIFDASNIDDKYIADKQHINKILTELPGILNMSILSGPNIVDGELVNPGISGFCIIDYSHVSIHTFTKPKEALIDIFSCKPYNPKAVKDYLLASFQVAEDSIRFFEVKYE